MKTKFTIVLIVFTFLASAQEKIDTITQLTIPEETDLYFYKNRDYAFNITYSTIIQNRSYFKYNFIRKISENPEDTIWLNDKVKKVFDFEVKVICLNLIKSGKAMIINWHTKSIVKRIHFKSYLKIPTTYNQYIDHETDSIIIQELTPWIGCPSF